MKVLDAGARERAALLELHRRDNPVTPFWRWLEIVEYDPATDAFTFPTGRIVTVQRANNPDQKEGS